MPTHNTCFNGALLALWRKKYIDLTKQHKMFFMVENFGFGIVENEIKLPETNDDLNQTLALVKTEPIFERLVPRRGALHPEFGTRKRLQTVVKATTKINRWAGLGKKIQRFLFEHFHYE